VAPPPPSGLKTPGVKTLGMKTPGVKTPGMKTLGMKTPGMETPGVKTLGMKTQVVPLRFLVSPGAPTALVRTKTASRVRRSPRGP
jgi:hypothetical protein